MAIHTKKNGVIISALGKDTFSLQQVERIEAVMNTKFYARLDPMDSKEFIRVAKDAQILAVTRRPLKDIGADIIDALPYLEGIALYSTGYEWIDLDRLHKKGIKLSFLPDYATITVAEHTLAAMLVMSRRIHLSFDKIRSIVPPSTSLRGWELRGKSLGIIGFGRIGQEIAKLTKPFGMNICYFDKIKADSETAKYVSREALLSTVDIIVIASSKTRNSSPIITAEELDMVKPGVYIINIARSDLVDNGAILEAIRNKTVAGYMVDDAVDVLTKDKTIENGRILQTGHTAWYSDEAIERGTEEWVKNIISLAEGKPLNIVIRSA